MLGFRLSAQKPPAAERVTDVVVSRYEHVYEVDPRLMERHVLQQVFPNWDTLRIMRSRHDHLDWMHRHFAEKVVTGSEILAEIEASGAAATTGSAPPRGLYDRVGCQPQLIPRAVRIAHRDSGGRS